jgi:hypothetical protein
MCVCVCVCVCIGCNLVYGKQGETVFACLAGVYYRNARRFPIKIKNEDLEKDGGASVNQSKAKIKICHHCKLNITHTPPIDN